MTQSFQALIVGRKKILSPWAGTALFLWWSTGNCTGKSYRWLADEVCSGAKVLHWYPPTGTRRINSPNSRQRHHCVQTTGITTGRARLIRTQLIRSSTLFEVSVKCFPIISCFKGTVNSYFHLFRRKSLPTKDFELTMPLLQFFSKLALLAFSVVVKTRCLGFYQK